MGEREQVGTDRAACFEAAGYGAAVQRVLELTAAATGGHIAHYLDDDAPPAPVGTVDLPVRVDGDHRTGILRVAATTEPWLRDVLVTLLAEQQQASNRAHRHWRERVQRIREVLDGRSVPMAYQPIVDLQTEQIVGYEALARFPGLPARTPDRWFAEANALGMGVELEVLAVVMALGALPAVPGDAYLSINVSPDVAASPLLGAALEDAPLQRIVLEITEHEAVADYRLLNRRLLKLRRGGLRIAVDDAGSGYASFRHVLKTLPDIIKLDTTLVREIDADATQRALSYSLSSFASALDACVVAEGVETERELDALRFLGVRHAQGYFLGRPGPLPGGGQQETAPSPAHMARPIRAALR